MQAKLQAFFYARTSNQSAAEDLVHDVFYAALKSIHSFKGQSTIETWIFSIARHKLKNYYRSTSYQQQMEENMKMSKTFYVESPEKQYLLHEEMALLLEKIEGLDDLRKDIMTLRIFGELSFKEIGDLVGKSENYVRVNFHRMKIKIQLEMEEED